MPWSTPSFEEIKMDAEARGYGAWVGDADAPGENQTAAPEPAADASEDDAGPRG